VFGAGRFRCAEGPTERWWWLTSILTISDAFLIQHEIVLTILCRESSKDEAFSAADYDHDRSVPADHGHCHGREYAQ